MVLSLSLCLCVYVYMCSSRVGEPSGFRVFGFVGALGVFFQYTKPLSITIRPLGVSMDGMRRPNCLFELRHDMCNANILLVSEEQHFFNRRPEERGSEPDDTVPGEK